MCWDTESPDKATQLDIRQIDIVDMEQTRHSSRGLYLNYHFKMVLMKHLFTIKS